MIAENVYTILQKHINPCAVSYCFSLWEQSPFELKLTKTRQTKVGDFTSRRDIAHPRITLNHDLNQHLFLLTYVHEVAHLRVHKKYRNKVDPHGQEWKDSFRELMEPLLQDNAFPQQILHELRKHMVNPKASSFADVELTKILRSYDKGVQFISLSDIPEGSTFSIQGRFFKKGKLKRTRYLCQEIKARRNYLVPSEALVSNVQLSLL